ncbi:ATP-binding protein [Chitinophagaceae bacterium LB-8]|uniref:histidine kinase n=1 Tax=Paraflavisolibacter caeni TaxID=2982496 RepID=A0A9X3B7U1_9BACT|nr:ATP-binding protein [Paraflavisolibacter caeni]MCU7548856.1 ATP-binding protein [Paraflavisolibacter caeni]
MAEFFFNKVSKSRQYFLSLLFVCIVSFLCFVFANFIDYKIVAFILLVTVSLIAITFDIFPVLTAAVLSALIWNFFFIPPRFTFHVGSTEDTILFVMYFIIAMVNAVLTNKIKLIEKGAREKEEKSNTVKLYNTLLNSLSHELRTPIATIIAATDNLQTNSSNLTPNDKEELLAEISTASFRLNQQVENLLNMSRLESGFIQPKKDWCDINELVYDAVKRIEENKATQHITINISPNLPVLKLDKVMLEQIIYNLLNNACQYTAPDSMIQLKATYKPHFLEIVIEDNGDGFPEEEIKNVFEKFYRLKTSRTGGTGLGLSIVKGFTEAMGGSVLLQNVSTGGARFTLIIPAESTLLKKTDQWQKRIY